MDRPPLPLDTMASQTRVLTATDPLTGQTVTRRTARTYHAAIVWTGANGALYTYGWAGRPDLAAATLKKVHRAGVADARLAPVTADPWAAVEPVAQAAAPAPVAQAAVEPVAQAAVEPVAQAAAPAPVAPVAQAPVEPVAQARPRSLAPLAADFGRSLGLGLGLGRGGAIRPPLPTRRPVTLPGEEDRPPAPVAQGPGPELPTVASIRADAAAGRVVSLYELTQAQARERVRAAQAPTA